MLELKRIEHKNSFLQVYEDRGLVFGFTEQGFELRNLADFFDASDILELKQVHSDMVLFASQAEPGDEGDGIILDRQDKIAIIKTADCAPLFFWDKEHTTGGILHVGWQGLHKGIEKRLLELLAGKTPPVDFGALRFYIGPAIDGVCYEVGRDLYELFSRKSYRDEIFVEKAAAPTPAPTAGKKYQMDIKLGIRLSLQEEGIRAEQVESSGICTFCEKERFPSYRRDNKTGARIYNFLAFGDQGALLKNCPLDPCKTFV